MDISHKDQEALERLLENTQKIQLLSEINEVLQERQEVVQKHNKLLQNASDLQNQVQETKLMEHAFVCAHTSSAIQKLWLARVEETRKRGTDLESELKALRHQLALAQQQSGNTSVTSIKITEPLDSSKSSKDMPSRKANYKITASRLQGEIKTLQHRVNTTKLRLLTEVKNKSQAENEVRQLRLQLSRRNSNAPSAAGTPISANSPRSTENVA